MFLEPYPSCSSFSLCNLLQGRQGNLTHPLRCPMCHYSPISAFTSNRGRKTTCQSHSSMSPKPNVKKVSVASRHLAKSKNTQRGNSLQHHQRIFGTTGELKSSTVWVTCAGAVQPWVTVTRGYRLQFSMKPPVFNRVLVSTFWTYRSSTAFCESTRSVCLRSTCCLTLFVEVTGSLQSTWRKRIFI